MKINTDNLKEKIQEAKPNLKENSIKQYEIHLNKLKKLFDTDNYDFLSKPEDVMEKIKDKHYTSQRNTLNAIIILLLALNSDNKYDELIEKYQKIRDKFNQQYIDSNEDGKVSESQKQNFVDLSEIQNMLKEMENKIKSDGLKKKTNLSGKEKELLMVYTIFSFLVRYTLRLDLAGMKYISRTQYNGLSEQDKKDGNYLVHNKKGSQFLEAILNEYKTSKKYGEMTYDEIVASDSISNLDKANLLEGWIKKKIRKEKEQVEDLFDSFVAESPVKARGYIRNNYIIYSKGKEGKQNLDTAAQTLWFKTADKYLSESETISDELTRRMKLLAIVPNIRENEPYD